MEIVNIRKRGRKLTVVQGTARGSFRIRSPVRTKHKAAGITRASKRFAEEIKHEESRSEQIGGKRNAEAKGERKKGLAERR